MVAERVVALEYGGQFSARIVTQILSPPLDEGSFGTPIETTIDANAVRALRTYYVYVHAFSSLLPPDAQAAQRQLPALQKLQGCESSPSAVIEEPLFRGWLTLRAMELLPIAQYPELAMTANFWAPVQ